MPICVQQHLRLPSSGNYYSKPLLAFCVNMKTTLWMIGKIASFFEDDEAADARPFGRWESGTRMGLCRRIARFFCDLPIFRWISRSRNGESQVQVQVSQI